MIKTSPFKLDVPEATLDRIRTRITEYPWHEQRMPDDGGWAYGTNLDYLKEFCDYWLEEYDWRKHEAIINGFRHRIADVDGLDLHYIYEKGSGSAPMPLIISHGWPGSIVEFLHIIEPLAHPERFGGSVDDAFDLILPSLPGFGFSGQPPRPYGPRRMAEFFNKLMTEVSGL